MTRPRGSLAAAANGDGHWRPGPKFSAELEGRGDVEVFA
jgi:hypothetical protein